MAAAAVAAVLMGAIYSARSFGDYRTRVFANHENARLRYAETVERVANLQQLVDRMLIGSPSEAMMQTVPSARAFDLLQTGLSVVALETGVEMRSLRETGPTQWYNRPMIAARIEIEGSYDEIVATILAWERAELRLIATRAVIRHLPRSETSEAHERVLLHYDVGILVDPEG